MLSAPFERHTPYHAAQNFDFSAQPRGPPGGVMLHGSREEGQKRPPTARRPFRAPNTPNARLQPLEQLTCAMGT